MPFRNWGNSPAESGEKVFRFWGKILDEIQSLCGLGTHLAMRHFDAMCENFSAAIENACTALAGKGFPDAARMKQQILACGGYRHV